MGINVPVRRPHTLAHARNEVRCLAGARETLRSACCVVGACVALSPLGGIIVVFAWVSRARLVRVLVCVRSAADAKLGVGPPSETNIVLTLDLLAPWKRSRERLFLLLLV